MAFHSVTNATLCLTGEMVSIASAFDCTPRVAARLSKRGAERLLSTAWSAFAHLRLLLRQHNKVKGHDRAFDSLRDEPRLRFVRHQ